MRNSKFLQFNALWFLIGFNVVMFLLTFGLATLVSGSVDNAFNLFLYLLGGLQNALALSGEWWRLVTSTFLHADILHIAFNMFALYQIGKIVRQYYGGKFLFYAYILCGLMGSVLSLIFLGTNSATVGASGAVFGLIGVILIGSAKRSQYGIELPFRPLDILPLALYAFVIGLLPGSNVNNWTHLGGFVMGLILGWVINHRLNGDPQGWRKVLDKTLFWVSIILFVGAYVWMLMSLPGMLTLV